MEDQVSFKVYAYSMRTGVKPEVRRFGVDRNVVTSYTYLLAKINEVFPNLKGKTISITWRDEEGDMVKISSDDEVMTMLATIPSQLFKLYVSSENETSVPEHQVNYMTFSYPHLQRQYMPVSYPVGSVSARPQATLGPQRPPANGPQRPPANGPQGPAAAQGPPIGLRHSGVLCDSCNCVVQGYRYKCLTCEDFDLCARCEQRGMHADHCFVRMPTPNVTPQMIKEVIKKSQQVLKTYIEAQKKLHAETKKNLAAGVASSSSCSMHPTMSPHLSKTEAKAASKERREERREEKRQEKHERREEARRERADNPRERVGWMDVFSKYVDQFANLAADHIRVATSETAEQTSPTGDHTSIPFDPTEFARMMNACMNMRESGCPVADMFAQANGSGTPQDSAPSQSQAPTAPEAPTAQQAPTQAPVAQQAPAQVTPQAPVTPQVPSQAPQVSTTAPITSQVAPTPEKPAEGPIADKSDAGSVTSSEGSIRDVSPDKSAEDWTMINNDKDLEPDTSAGQLLMDANLPEEFQPRPGAAYGFIYPPLNVATAEPMVPTKTDTASAPQDANGATPRGPSAQAQAAGGPLGQAANQAAAYAESLAQAGQTKVNQAAAYVASMAQEGQARAKQAAAYAETLAQAAQVKANQSAAAARPTAEERQHRVPHIDAAIRQMIAMGFTNEGGWLTQLVESKDGNIAAVLDLLTPVHPRTK